MSDFSKQLSAAVAELHSFPDEQKIEMRGGKRYVQVKDRADIFRRHFGTNARLETEALRMDEVIQFRAKVVIDDKVVATGHAENLRSKTKDAVVEKTETKAIGRALAVFGLAGSEFASVEEMIDVGALEKVVETVEKPLSEYPLQALLDSAYDKFLALAPNNKDHVSNMNRGFGYFRKLLTEVS